MKANYLFAALVYAVRVAPWVVTSYYEVDIVTPYSTGRTITISLPISPTVAVLPSPITVSTSIGAEDLTVVEIVLPSGAGAQQTYDPSHLSAPLREFYVMVTYSTIETCIGTTLELTTTSTLSLFVPFEVKSILNGSTIGTSTMTDFGDNFEIISILANPSDIDPSVLSSASSLYAPYTWNSSCTHSTTTFKTATVSLSASRTATAATSTATFDGTTEDNIKCGKSNPNCDGCTYWVEYCYGDCAPITATYYECSDGKRYYGKGGPMSKRTKIIIACSVVGGFFGVIGLIILVRRLKNSRCFS